MELEQLVSFVRYQLGQKQGWDALDQVLTVVQDSAQRVKEADEKVEEAEARLRKIEELCQSKLDEADDAVAKVESVLAEKEAGHTARLEELAAEYKSERDALTKEISDLRMAKESVRVQINGMAGQVKVLEDERYKAQDELDRVKGLLADLKARL